MRNERRFVVSRPLRVIRQNVTYHCYSRCIEKRNILTSDFVKNIALSAVRKAKKKYKFDLSYIEFVEDHVHIVIKTLSGEANISRIMQYIKARITERCNLALGRIGPLWNERFKSEIIEDYENPAEKFVKLIWYLAYNPVRRGLYADPRKNKYSGIHKYLGSENEKRRMLPINLHEYFINLGLTANTRIMSFLKYEKEYVLNGHYC
jgi:REP element-mobilizing transposase RayT